MPWKLVRPRKDYRPWLVYRPGGPRFNVAEEEPCYGHADSPGCIVMTPVQLETSLAKIRNLLATLEATNAGTISRWHWLSEKRRQHYRLLLQELARCRLMLRHAQIVEPAPRPPLEYASQAKEAYATLVGILEDITWEVASVSKETYDLRIQAFTAEDIVAEFVERTSGETLQFIFPNRYVECGLRIRYRSYGERRPSSVILEFAARRLPELMKNGPVACTWFEGIAKDGVLAMVPVSDTEAITRWLLGHEASRGFGLHFPLSQRPSVPLGIIPPQTPQGVVVPSASPLDWRSAGGHDTVMQLHLNVTGECVVATETSKFM